MMDAKEAKIHALNLWKNPAWTKTMDWAESMITEKTNKALEMEKEERDAELDKCAHFREFKKMLINKIRNSI